MGSGESRNSIDQYQTILPPIIEQNRPSLAALQDKHTREERKRAQAMNEEYKSPRKSETVDTPVFKYDKPQEEEQKVGIDEPL